MRSRLVLALFSLFASLTLLATACNTDAGTTLKARTWDPIVLAGSELPSFVGAEPADLVAFRHNTDTGGWEQVPVQVDERHLEDASVLRNGSGAAGFDVLAYSDPGSNAGDDPDATFDPNDELALMADDTGGEPPADAPYPAGVIAGTGRALEVTDPVATPPNLRGGRSGFVYLFEQDGSLDPSAGMDYVSYSFADNDSDIVTDTYTSHFSARWTRDVITIEGEKGDGTDILDRHRNLFALGSCVRTEDTFSSGPGGYATNIDGPVRAIRSYLGANSGTYTQREHVFYRSYERVQTFLRVHAIPGMIDIYDMSPDADGMTYRNNLEPDGVSVDGSPDVLDIGGTIEWEAWSGAQGALVSVQSYEADFSPTIAAYYEDDDTPPNTQCTGDAFEYGAGGNWITSAIPNTDPTRDAGHKTFTQTRHNIYDHGVFSGLSAQFYVDSVENPLSVTNTAFG